MILHLRLINLKREDGKGRGFSSSKGTSSKMVLILNGRHYLNSNIFESRKLFLLGNGNGNGRPGGSYLPPNGNGNGNGGGRPGSTYGPPNGNGN